MRLLRFLQALHERNFYRRLAWAVPLLIVRAGLPLLPVLPDAVATAAQSGVAVGMLVVLASAIGVRHDVCCSLGAFSEALAAR